MENFPPNSSRQSGRTTTALKKAIELAKAGHKVQYECSTGVHDPGGLMFDDLQHSITETSRLINDSYGPQVGFEARLYRRTTNKLAEEVGEVALAIAELLGENPRKPADGSIDKVMEELLDVAACALGAWEWLDGFQGRSFGALAELASRKHARLVGALAEEQLHRQEPSTP